MALVTLKKRPEFLRIRGGARWSSTSFVLETRPRADTTAPEPAVDGAGPRFGFTITKQIGKAVDRNRIRRRLKAALDELAPAFARPGYDYVVVARGPALDRPFVELKKELEDALHRVHHAPGRRQKPRSQNGEKAGNDTPGNTTSGKHVSGNESSGTKQAGREKPRG